MKLFAWIQALRLKFLPQGVVPVLIGTALAIHLEGVFRAYYFLLAFLGMTLVQFGLTMLDDWHDYIRGTDRTKSDEKNPYSGGSGVLTDGTITPKEMITVVAIFYVMASLIGFYLTWQRGTGILYMMLAGFFISIFYSLPPFQFAYRGIGELMMLLGYGPTITLGAFYVQAQRFSPEAFLSGLLPGILMWTMIVVNEIPDYDEDKRNNKQNLVVRLGRKTGIHLFGLGLTAVYLFIVAFVVAGIFPPATLLGLLSVPFAGKALSHLRMHYMDTLGVADANRYMVIVYSMTTLLFTLGLLL